MKANWKEKLRSLTTKKSIEDQVNSAVSAVEAKYKELQKFVTQKEMLNKIASNHSTL